MNSLKDEIAKLVARATQGDQTAIQQLESAGLPVPELRGSPASRLSYSLDEFGALHGMGRTKAFAEAAAGRVRTFKIGRLTRVTREEAVAYGHRLTTEQGAA